MKEGIHEGKVKHFSKVKEEVENLKMSKAEQRELIEMQKRQEQLKNTSIKQMVWNQERQVEDKKKLLEEERRA